MKTIKNKQMRITLLLILSLLGVTLNAQTIDFTFENVNTTFDGTDYWYEADIYIATVDGMADFKVGSGLLYFNYNTDAFGENVFGGTKGAETPTDNIEFLQPDSSIIGQVDSTFGADIYGTFITNNNTSSRVAVSFQQVLAEVMIPANNVTSTPAHLLSFRLRFVDNTKAPNVTLANTEVTDGDDQFFTACGPSTASGPFTVASCVTDPGVQIINSTEDSSNATDTTAPVITLLGDNPQIITSGDSYTEFGATSDDGLSVVIDASAVNTNLNGDYEVTYNLTDDANNIATEVKRIVRVEPTLSNNLFKEDESIISIYPNPVLDTLFINTDFEIAILYNLSGALITKTITSKIEMNELPSGIYLLEVTTKKGVDTLKVIKK